MKNRASQSQIAAFRMARHHLTDRRPASLADVCRDVCGVQAQVLSAAEMSLWTRRPATTRDEVRAALLDHRTLVRTGCMRETLHLIDARDFGAIIAALQASRLRRTGQIMTRYGVSPDDTRRVTEAVLEALSAGPLDKRELATQVLDRNLVRGKARKWFELSSWSVTRRAIVEGLVCYGPAPGAEARFALAEQWLGKRERVPADEAQRVLLRRFLSAYGPATARDFAKWSGLGIPEAQAVFDAAADELAEVALEDGTGFILSRDLPSLRNSALDGRVVRLLPNFDTYLLAHASKGHLVDPAACKRVYRNQGWISPTVLVDGKVAGTWAIERAGKWVVFEISPFAAWARDLRARVEEECAGLGKFLDAPYEIVFAPSRSRR